MKAMTEKEWFNSVDVDTMLAFVAGREAPAGAVLPLVPMSERKLRLFLVGSCRRHWHRFEDLECRQAIEVAERFADGEASQEQRKFQEENTRALRNQWIEEALAGNRSKKMLIWAIQIASMVNWTFDFMTRRHRRYGAPPTYIPIKLEDRRIWADQIPREIVGIIELVAHESNRTESKSQKMQKAEKTAQVHLLRCIVGNPFRLPNIDPAWFNLNVNSIADRIYSERDFALLPILADALEEAGCNNQEMLQHCRQSTEHARGCWVVDLVLGKP
jgi:hypothetical protein